MKLTLEKQERTNGMQVNGRRPKVTPENYVLEELIFRHPTEDDLEDVANFLNLTWGAFVGFDEFNVQELRHQWEAPGFDPQKQIRLITDPDGRILAFAECYLREPFARSFGWVQVLPDWRQTEIVEQAYNWVEAFARETIPKAPADARVSLVAFSSGKDTFTQGFLALRGYTLIRRFLKMLIEMDGPPPEPKEVVGLDGKTPLKIVAMQVGEERAVVEADREAFRDHWGFIERPFEVEMKMWEHRMAELDFDPSLWFLAKDGDQIAGISLCRPFITGEEDTGWVSVLGVLRPWRRKGLATALLHHTFGEFYRRGQMKVGLDVDAQSLTGATRLYEKVGMHIDHEFHDYEIELRPGIELGTTEVEGKSDGN